MGACALVDTIFSHVLVMLELLVVVEALSFHALECCELEALFFHVELCVLRVGSEVLHLLLRSCVLVGIPLFHVLLEN